MKLKRLLSQDRLRPHKTSKEEINNLLRLIKRDIKDAKVQALSHDRQFATAYNAVLQMAIILLYCKGYKPSGIGQHFTAFQMLKEVMGKEYYALSDYFDSCRAKRNLTDYSYAGKISKTEVEELIIEAERFMEVIVAWLKNNYPKLL